MPYRIKNWREFQHYRDRWAPWVKLYPDVARDFEFRSMPERSQLRLIFIWLAAQRFKKKLDDEPLLPENPAALSLAASIDITAKDLDPIVSAGFLILETDSRASLDLVYGEGEGYTTGYTTGEKKEGASRPVFIKPSSQDVDAYILERGYRGFSGEEFVAFYQSKGWVIGKQPMKDWKAAVTTWAKRHGKDAKRADGLTGNTSDPNRPCAYCGGPYPCKCYEEADRG